MVVKVEREGEKESENERQSRVKEGERKVNGEMERRKSFAKSKDWDDREEVFIPFSLDPPHHPRPSAGL